MIKKIDKNSKICNKYSLKHVKRLVFLIIFKHLKKIHISKWN